MGKPLTNTAFAELAGITKQGVGHAVKNRLIHKGKGGIDPEHPVNRLYLEDRKKKDALEARKGKKPKAKKGKKVNKKTKTAVKTEIENNLTPEQIKKYGEVWDLDDQKKKQETRYKRIQADKAALDYAERLDLMVDDKTLRRKFGIFFDHILNDLVALPDSIADILVNVMESSDDPTMAVADILKQSIKDIIKKGKRAARKVKPPKSGRKYVIRKADWNEQPKWGRTNTGFQLPQRGE